MTTDKIHPFEKAGLGHAPFRVTGVDRKVFYACPGAPAQHGGSCDYCGTGITYHFYIRGSGPKDKEFHVGSDCVAKTEDKELIKCVKVLQTAEEKKLKAEKAAERGAASEKKYAAILKKLDTIGAGASGAGDWAQSTAKDIALRVRKGADLSEKQIALVDRMWSEFERMNAPAAKRAPVENAILSKLDTLATAGMSGANIAADMAVRVRQGRTLSEKQEELVDNLWQKLERSKAPKKAPTGEVGKRVDLELTLRSIKRLGSKVFGGHVSSTFMWIFEAKDGSEYKWFGSSLKDTPPEVWETFRDGYEGDTWRGSLPCKVRGTITEHTEYKGTPQTILSRCKVEFNK